MSAPHLRVVAPPTRETLPNPEDLAADQVAEVFERLDADPSDVLRWPFHALDRQFGALLPGSVHVIGAGTGNGKSSFLMSLTDAWSAAGIGVLYLPLEIDPPTARMRWAAWRCGFAVEDVFERAWHDHPDVMRRRLPEGAKEALAAETSRLAVEVPVHFPKASTITPNGVRQWAEWGMTRFGAKVVIVDHLHQLDLGDQPNGVRHVMGQAAHLFNEMAKQLGLVVLCAAQLNRTSNALDAYEPPTLDRLRESSVIAEVATSVLMLSRRIRKDATAAEIADAAKTRQGIAELAAPGLMQITCRKHRLRDSARDRAALLRVKHGRVTDLNRYADEDHQP
jgi:replicative DNA helicase